MDLSVIICTFNRQDQLELVLESINRCIIPKDIKLEIIIIDNNSNDNTKDIVNKYVTNNHGIYKYVFEKRQGKSFALNTAFNMLRGKS